MTNDQSANRTQGETHGPEQQPVEATERDTTQQGQEAREGRPPTQDPAAPDAEQEDSIRMAESPDAAYGQREDQA